MHLVVHIRHVLLDLERRHRVHDFDGRLQKGGLQGKREIGQELDVRMRQGAPELARVGEGLRVHAGGEAPESRQRVGGRHRMALQPFHVGEPAGLVAGEVEGDVLDLVTAEAEHEGDAPLVVGAQGLAGQVAAQPRRQALDERLPVLGLALPAAVEGRRRNGGLERIDPLLHRLQILPPFNFDWTDAYRVLLLLAEPLVGVLA